MNLTHQQAQALIEQPAHSLKAGELSALRQHLDTCTACRAFADEFHQRETLLKNSLQTSNPRLHYPAGQLHQIASNVQRQARTRRFVAWFAGGIYNLTWAGLTVGMVLGLVWLVNNIPVRTNEPAITALPSPLLDPTLLPTALPVELPPDETPAARVPTTQPDQFTTQIPVSRQYRMTLTGHKDRVTSVAFSPDGQTLASADTLGVVNVWQVQEGNLLYSLQAHTKAISSVAFSPDGKTLATGGKDGRVILWQAQTGQFIRLLMDELIAVKSVAYSPDGEMLAISLNEYRVDVIEVATGTVISGSTGYSRFEVSTSASNNYLLASSQTAVWLNASSQLPFGLNLRGQGGKSLDAVLSPDGKFLASGSTDHKIYFWQIYDVTYSLRLTDAEMPDLEKTTIERQVFGVLDMFLEGHTGWVNSLGFSPDQQYLISGAGDGMIKLWHLPNGEVAATLKGHQAGINGIAISPNGQWIASASDDGTVKLWALEP